MSQHTLIAPTSGVRRGPRVAANFTVLSNAVINDARLSFRARGVLMWLLSKPADWRTRSIAIAAQSPREGRDSIRTAMRELEEFGYLTRERVRDSDGRFRIVQTIHEIPADSSAAPEPEIPDTGSTDAGQPGATQRTGSSPRTDTNTPPNPQPKPSPTERAPKRVGVMTKPSIDERFTGLAAACRERGMAARWDCLKPEQAELIEGLLGTHGVDALARAAGDAHRSSNPTRYAQGWINTWFALPLPRNAAPQWSSCGRCDDQGWIQCDPTVLDGAVRRCSCRTVRAESVPA
ncbi:replication protein [Rhodococcus hoagii]|nr:replication protein [Prescottella equi]MBM4651005.1 replication protein [Prescottella equi]MBM4686648.1 replication protein [Prescottella equi]